MHPIIFLNALRAEIRLIIAVRVQQSLKRLFPHFPYRLRVFQPRLCRLNFHARIYTRARTFLQWKRARNHGNQFLKKGIAIS